MEPVESFKKVALGESLSDWLKSTQGLLEINSCWRSALYALKKTGYFYEKDFKKYKKADTAYRELKEGSYLAGVSILLDDSKIKTYRYKDWAVDGETGESKECEREDLVGTGIYRIVLNLVFSFTHDVVDHYLALPDVARQFLADHVWESLSRLDPFLLEDGLTSYTFTVKFYDEEFNLVELTNEQYEAKLNDPKLRFYKWSEEYDTGPPLDYILNPIEIEVLDDHQSLKSICGCSFPELSAILKSSKLEFRGTHLDGSYEGLSLWLTRWEQKLASYLLEQGFIVSLEPSVLFPQPSIENYREPDLLVFNKGRVIAVEIDDRSHLMKKMYTKKGGFLGSDANLEKWERDRVLDRFFLMNGIPVLRVWYEEVDKTPELVMSYILSMFDSLGGGRMIYK